MRKKIVLFAVFQCLLSLSASAMPCCAQFGGFYVGGNLGWGHNDYQFDDYDGLGQVLDTGLPHTIRTEKNGVLGGLQIGYNWQPCCALLGLEADWNATSIKHSTLALDGDTGALHDTINVKHRLPWFGTVRARAGVVVDNLLLYATGGFAYARGKHTWDFFQDAPAFVESFKSHHTRFGGVGGFGAEWALGCNLSLRGEMLYVRFGQDERSFTSEFHNPGVTYKFFSHDSLFIGRIGINYIWGCGCR